MKVLGLRSLIYPTSDLEASKKWWIQLLGIQPYFDQPFYVGFNVGGFEIGLNPGANREHGAVTYLGVNDIHEAMNHLIKSGGREESPIEDVGDAILLATVISPQGERFGFIQNPHFTIEEVL